MFTGLIETTGIITAISTNHVSIKTEISKELNIGDSISVNGTCLTVTSVQDDCFGADLSPETFNVTNFAEKKKGDMVNLERAMLLSSRLNGHLVYGHVDTTANVLRITKSENFYTLVLAIKPEFKNYIVKKGSITVDGVSLTIADEVAGEVKIAIIPHTWEVTALKKLNTDSIVNIEFDIISKYIEKNTNIYHNKSRINLEFLEENGFV